MSNIVIRRHQIPLTSLPSSAGPLRIVQLSDFHFRWWESLHDRIQRRLAGLDYDVLMMTGDFCLHPFNHRLTATLIRRFVAPLKPRLGCYAVPGNHDPVVLSEHFTQGPPRFLRNESVVIHHNGHPINLAGLDDSWRSTSDVPRALAGCRNGHPTILLCHIPSTAFYLPDGVVDLVLCGHTHGGQWRIPFWGSVTVNDRITRAQTHGLHRIDNRWVHVTAGVGASGPFQFRLNCPAEISLLTLVPDGSGGRAPDD